jgi:hypothetical protein
LEKIIRDLFLFCFLAKKIQKLREKKFCHVLLPIHLVIFKVPQAINVSGVELYVFFVACDEKITNIMGAACQNG